MNLYRRIIKFTSSLKLAVIVILSLGFIAAIGTIVESRYDAQRAQQLVLSFLLYVFCYFSFVY